MFATSSFALRSVIQPLAGHDVVAALLYPTLWVLTMMSIASGVLCQKAVDRFARASFMARRGVTRQPRRQRQPASAIAQRHQEKTNFIASAVHDLRQPVQALALIGGALSRSIEQSNGPLTRQLLDVSRAATRNLQEELAAILDISRLDSGGIQPATVDGSLAQMLRQLPTDFARETRTHRVDLEVRLPAHLPVHTDPLFVQRMVNNLVSNGIKYSDPAKPLCQVWVTGRLLEHACELVVRDNGIGIESDAVKDGRMFEAFYQRNNRHAQGVKGVGLGLAIVRAKLKLLANHHLDLQSEVGVGSTFTLMIPLSHAPINLITAGTKPRKPPTGPVLVGAAHLGCTLWLVEDEQLVRSTLVPHRMPCYGRLFACDRHRAFLMQMATSPQAPDVLLCDFRLPNSRTAVDVVDALHQRWPATPVVVFSSETRPFDTHPALEGAVIMHKPVDAQTLLQALQNCHAASGRQAPANLAVA